MVKTALNHFKVMVYLEFEWCAQRSNGVYGQSNGKNGVYGDRMVKMAIQ